MDLIDSTSRGPGDRPNLNPDAVRVFLAAPKVLYLVSEFFAISMNRVLNDQKLDILSKFKKYRHLNLSTTFLEMRDAEIEEIMDRREADFNQHIIRVIHLLCDFVVDDNTTSEHVTEASWLLRRLRELDRQWGTIKEVLDVANIIGDWMTVPELNRFNIHFTKIGAWNDCEWNFFQQILANYGLKIVKYKVGRWNPEKESAAKKQGKSKRKSAASSRRNRPDVLFNKYETRQFFAGSSLDIRSEV